MGAYICGICDNMFCSHEVNYYSCEKCEREFCESCWSERLDEKQDVCDDICGECFADLQPKAAKLTEPK